MSSPVLLFFSPLFAMNPIFYINRLTILYLGVFHTITAFTDYLSCILIVCSGTHHLQYNRMAGCNFWRFILIYSAAASSVVGAEKKAWEAFIRLGSFQRTTKYTSTAASNPLSLASHTGFSSLSISTHNQVFYGQTNFCNEWMYLTDFHLMFLSSRLIGSPASHVKNVNPLRLEENGTGSWISVVPNVRCTLGICEGKTLSDAQNYFHLWSNKENCLRREVISFNLALKRAKNLSFLSFPAGENKLLF